MCSRRRRCRCRNHRPTAYAPVDRVAACGATARVAAYATAACSVAHVATDRAAQRATILAAISVASAGACAVRVNLAMQQQPNRCM